MALFSAKAVFGDWLEPLAKFGILSSFKGSMEDLRKEYETRVVYPPKGQVFRAFRETPYDKLKVVMVFQDPYPDGNATGIAIANEPEFKYQSVSPTLRAVLKEWAEDQSLNPADFQPDLLHWCEQGVLMLNCALTVEHDKKRSHVSLWKPWTEAFMSALSIEKKNLIWCFFGQDAKSYSNNVVNGIKMNFVHPAAEGHSGGRSGFYGSRPFTRINDQLIHYGLSPIIW